MKDTNFILSQTTTELIHHNDTNRNIELSLDIISFITTSIIAIVGIIIARSQLKQVVESLDLQKSSLEKQSIAIELQQKNICDELCRIRKENAINHALRWNSLEENVYYAFFIVKNLTKDDAEELYKKGEKIVILKRDFKYLKYVFDEDISFDENSESFELNSSYIISLRSHIISWLNKLESILISFKYDVADKEILENEFKEFLFEDDEFILNDFYHIAGKNKYPGITYFINHIQKNRIDSELQIFNSQV